ncbi:MAG: TetR/AcrR family transcriptional regulator [Dermatophilaceae bacterium]
MLLNVTPGKSLPVGADTASRLLESAARAFASKGFHATTTRDIAQGAELSPAGVYIHFGSKLDVLFDLSRRGHEQALALVTAAAQSAPTPARALARILERFSAWHVANFELARVAYHEFAHLEAAQREELLRLRAEIDRAIQDVVTSGVRSGEFVVDDVADTSMALMSIVIDVARWYSPASERSPEQVGRTNAALGLRLVGVPPDADEPAGIPTQRSQTEQVQQRAEGEE